MKDGTGTPFIELSEKLAKTEAERDAFKKSAEVAHDVAISVARAMGIPEAVVSEGRLVAEVERLAHLAACQIRCEAKREAAEARAEAAEAALEKATQSEYAASLDAENAKLGKLGVQFNDSKCQRPTCRAVEARAEAAEAALADPAAETELRDLRRIAKASAKHYKDHGSRTHSNDCDVCLAVERYQKAKR